MLHPAIYKCLLFLFVNSGLDSFRFPWYQTGFIRKVKIYSQEWTEIFTFVWILFCSGKQSSKTIWLYVKMTNNCFWLLVNFNFSVMVISIPQPSSSLSSPLPHKHKPLVKIFTTWSSFWVGVGVNLVPITNNTYKLLGLLTSLCIENFMGLFKHC